MSSNLAPKAQAYLLILRWALSLIFFVMVAPKFFDTGFGANADNYFYNLRDNIIIPPYTVLFDKVILPNVYIIASFIKYAELAIAVIFFLGWPMRPAVLLATFLHLNYICIANFPSLLYLNGLMIICEWVCLAVVESNNEK